MRIEDDELRELFIIESEEHLQQLDDGLIKLEKNPDDHDILAVVFREAHSLKGAAHMLGLTDIENISHHLEDLFGMAAKDTSFITPDIIDRVCAGIDAIRMLSRQAITGEPADLTVDEVIGNLTRIGSSAPDTTATVSETREAIADLEARTSAPPPAEPSGPPAQPSAETLQETSPAQPGFVLKTSTDCAAIPDAAAASKIDDFRIETIRVKTRQLDELMSQLGELTVSKIRINNRMDDLEQMNTVIEDLTRAVPGLESDYRGNESENSALTDLKTGIIELSELFNGFRNAALDDNARLDFIVAAMDDVVRNIRLLPLSTLFTLFPRMVRDLSRSQSKSVDIRIHGGDLMADKRILEEMKDPLMHIVRNAVDHGLELPEDREKAGKPATGMIQLHARLSATNIVIEIKDDGQGLDVEAIKQTALKRKLHTKEELAAMSAAQVQALIFTPGFSTSAFITNVSGRGVGLDVVRANVERLKGTFHVESVPGDGTTFRLRFPMAMATTRVLIVSVNRINYAIPVEHVQTTKFIYPGDMRLVEGREAMMFNNQAISVVRLADLLELRKEEGDGPNSNLLSYASAESMGRIPCIIIAIADERIALLVDDLTDEQAIVLKPPGSMLKRVRNISGTTILGTGEVCMVLNPNDMIKTARKIDIAPLPETPDDADKIKKRILAVDDSITTRTQIKRILERGGYEVVSAVDGSDAFTKLTEFPFDALVSDITMPVMDGLALTEKVRADKKIKELPVILVTALASEADRKKGLEVGADAYITKPAFDEHLLLDTLRRLI